MRIMEKDMETTRVYRDYVGYILGLYRDTEKENRYYYRYLG